MAAWCFKEFKTMTAAHTRSQPLTARLDHLVVAASSLDQGVAWCEKTLGITPGPGGEHPLMGTHNRLFSLASPAFPQAYFEIIAIHSGAPCDRWAGAKRWFDLDCPELQAQLAKTGPRLVHFVASTADAQASVSALQHLALERGELLQASRMTPAGLLTWKITVRDDGQRLFYGALPTLIQWGGIHPSHNMPASGVTLQSLQVSHPRPKALNQAYQAIGLAGISANAGAPDITATLHTPKGIVQLQSHGI
jgi:hypothetical protein